MNESFSQVRWARQPWAGRLGRYVAVRMRAGELQVAVAGSPHITWMPASRALSEREAATWAARGF